MGSLTKKQKSYQWPYLTATSGEEDEDAEGTVEEGVKKGTLPFTIEISLSDTALNDEAKVRLASSPLPYVKNVKFGLRNKTLK